MRRICVVTGSRAEYGLLSGLMKEVRSDPDLTLQIVATGMHLSPKFGLTYRAIEEDGFVIDRKVGIPLSDDSDVGITKALGTGVIGFADALAQLKPDVVVILGDRFEVFSAATAAMVARIPIAHIHGGESTEGCMDDSIRHAITKMAHLHFAAAEPYRQRIIRMGEPPDRVFCVGALGVENAAKLPLIDKESLEKSLDFTFQKPTFLVTLHPVTLEKRSSEYHIRELLSALDGFPSAKILFTQVNADPDHEPIRDHVEKYVRQNPERTAVHASLGHVRYLSALRYVDVVIGNSSSGVIEVPVFGKPTVNIGDRQKGRLMASSIIQCPPGAREIRKAISKALSRDFRLSLSSIDMPYFAKGTARAIKAILKSTSADDQLLKKGFYEGPR